ncbi:hypothetical protein ILUMI_13787 [Ignelater luminosus]|uniref:Uncharacterized protein n=1 Tax=Ignelater luminosus TaxID=2038154 RepID=A0A8K0CVI8_IGNLU|nr:hypothetical protein ILUMI_13787 [Ignelater luminosus]
MVCEMPQAVEYLMKLCVGMQEGGKRISVISPACAFGLDVCLRLSLTQEVLSKFLQDQSAERTLLDEFRSTSSRNDSPTSLSMKKHAAKKGRKQKQKRALRPLESSDSKKVAASAELVLEVDDDTDLETDHLESPENRDAACVSCDELSSQVSGGQRWATFVNKFKPDDNVDELKVGVPAIHSLYKDLNKLQGQIEKVKFDKEEEKTRGTPKTATRKEIEQPELLKTIIDIATHGVATDDRRRSEQLRSIKTPDELTKALKNDFGFNISRSAVYLRLFTTSC